MPLRRLSLWLERFLDPAEVRGPCSTSTGPSAGTAGRFPRARRATMDQACLLTVDDAGQCLLVAGARLTLGHLRAARADLLFLADVGACHAELVRTDSLHQGPGWSVGALGAERVDVDGIPVGRGGLVLCSGALVRLGENLCFRYELPDPWSSSACLELLRGAECAGARRIVLVGEGGGARVRIGAASSSHVRVPQGASRPEREVELVKEGRELLVRAPGFASTGEVRDGVCRLPYPPSRRVDFTSGERAGSRPPFGFSLSPVERPSEDAASERRGEG